MTANFFTLVAPALPNFPDAGSVSISPMFWIVDYGRFEVHLGTDCWFSLMHSRKQHVVDNQSTFAVSTCHKAGTRPFFVATYRSQSLIWAMVLRFWTPKVCWPFSHIVIIYLTALSDLCCKTPRSPCAEGTNDIAFGCPWTHKCLPTIAGRSPNNIHGGARPICVAAHWLLADSQMFRTEFGLTGLSKVSA